MKIEDTSCLEENMQWLQKNMPMVYFNLIKKSSQEDVVEEDFSDLGWNCLVRKSSNQCFRIHSTFDREREYDFFDNAIDAEHNMLVLFGCVDGNLIERLALNHPQIRHLVLIEPNRDLFISFLKRWKIEGTLSAFPQISLLINETIDIISAKVRSIMMKSTLESKIVSLVGTVNYRWNYFSYYQEIQNGLVEAIRHNKLNFHTVKAFIDLWMVNFWQNLRYGDAQINDFENLFEDKPAIVVSAGPSLDKNIQLLHKAREKALIIAVGSAISILEKKGIKPHFRMAIDPTLENEKLFEYTSSDDIPLVYSNHLFYKILPAYQGPKIHLALDSNSGFEEYLYDRAKVKVGKVSSGFSVANVAVNLLLYWKCDPVVFVGQDLAYTDDRLHASGSWDSDVEEKYIKKTSLRKDIWGNDVYTDNAFDGMRAVFENIISKNRGTKFINATEGGIPIEGAPNENLQDLLNRWEQPCCSWDEHIGAILNSSLRIENYETQRESIKEAVNILEKDVNAFLKKAKITVNYAQKLLNAQKMPTDNEARKIAGLFKKLQRHIVFKTVVPFFEELFRVRREGYLKKRGELTSVLPQVRLLYLEVNDIAQYLKNVKMMSTCYRENKECKIIFQ